MSDEQHPEHQEASNEDLIRKLFEVTTVMSDSIHNLTLAATSQLASIKKLKRRIQELERLSGIKAE